jgi:hypothetical protein
MTRIGLGLANLAFAGAFRNAEKREDALALCRVLGIMHGAFRNAEKLATLALCRAI